MNENKKISLHTWLLERRGDSPRLNSMGKTGSCGIAAEAAEAAGPPRIVGPEVSEPR